MSLALLALTQCSDSAKIRLAQHALQSYKAAHAMAGSSLLVLIDDIASILDDVALMSKVAAKKTAGVNIAANVF